MYVTSLTEISMSNEYWNDVKEEFREQNSSGNGFAFGDDENADVSWSVEQGTEAALIHYDKRDDMALVYSFKYGCYLAVGNAHGPWATLLPNFTSLVKWHIDQNDKGN